MQSTDDLQMWLQQARNTTVPKLEPIPEPVRFVPQPYQGGVALSPFSAENLSAALRAHTHGTDSQLCLSQPRCPQRRQQSRYGCRTRPMAVLRPRFLPNVGHFFFPSVATASCSGKWAKRYVHSPESLCTISRRVISLSLMRTTRP